ncbi:odontogenesis associated phosphoprotein isoform X1 [Papio anubis]|uniref:odontogenesis associated phosphoprotein isoform X1 n=1 Tax=Papio anubis TaxID=9555 RepID=UPI000B7B0540|nr:odontogenesis associated phosphoprotein isoform X1 [Papio anubis]
MLGHQDKKRYLPLLETHKITQTLPTARSLHSPLHPPRGVRSQGSSPSQRHLGVPSIFFHEGPESILGFQTDLSCLQGVTTVFRSSHFIGHTVALLLIDISPEEDSRGEAHLRKAEREEKPKHTEAKKKPILQKKQQKDFCFIFPN